MLWLGLTLSLAGGASIHPGIQVAPAAAAIEDVQVVEGGGGIPPRAQVAEGGGGIPPKVQVAEGGGGIPPFSAAV